MKDFYEKRARLLDQRQDYHSKYPVATLRKKVLAQTRWYAKPQTRILDVGCGDGVYLQELSLNGYVTTGVDLSKLRLTRAKKVSSSNLVCCDAQHLPLRDETFPIILCVETLEHIPTPNLVLREIWRVLQENGIMIMSVPVAFFRRFISRRLYI